MGSATDSRGQVSTPDPGASVRESLQYEAGRDVTILGKKVKRGEIVDTSSLTEWKVTQLLNLRILQPVRSKSET